MADASAPAPAAPAPAAADAAPKPRPNLDVALDDLVKQRRAEQPRAKKGDGAGGGPARRSDQKRHKNRERAAPYTEGRTGGGKARAPSPERWEHDRFDQPAPAPAARGPAQSRPPRAAPAAAPAQRVVEPARPSVFERLGASRGDTIIRISNLDFSVTEADLRELFSTVGTVVSATLEFNAAGRSRGIARVVFTTADAAQAAIKQYDGVSLDGRILQVKLFTPPATAAAAAPAASPRFEVTIDRVPSAPRGDRERNARGRDGARGGARGGRRDGHDDRRSEPAAPRAAPAAGADGEPRGGRGRGGRDARGGRGGRKPSTPLDAAALDADLDAYRASRAAGAAAGGAAE